MPRFTTLLLALATLSATATAQNANPAPIERATPQNNFRSQIAIFRPAAGIVVRASQNSSVRTVSADAQRTELTVERGVANVSVRHPENGVEILVNLPGGQTALLKDGLYTFNADTNTVRVLKGEAETFPTQDSKGIKIKEDHQLAFGSAPIRSVEVDPLQARADLLPGSRINRGYYEDGEGFYDYGYPYYGYGYPYGFYGYPFGLGFGYYRGFGGFHGGFHGHR